MLGNHAYLSCSRMRYKMKISLFFFNEINKKLSILRFLYNLEKKKKKLQNIAVWLIRI